MRCTFTAPVTLNFTTNESSEPIPFRSKSIALKLTGRWSYDQ